MITTEHEEEINYQPEIALWCAVIERAIDDLNNRNHTIRLGAEYFFESEWFEEICHKIGLDPAAVRLALARKRGWAI
jgi:hypothetical protein